MISHNVGRTATVLEVQLLQCRSFAFQSSQVFGHHVESEPIRHGASRCAKGLIGSPQARKTIAGHLRLSITIRMMTQDVSASLEQFQLHARPAVPIKRRETRDRIMFIGNAQISEPSQGFQLFHRFLKGRIAQQE